MELEVKGFPISRSSYFPKASLRLCINCIANIIKSSLILINNVATEASKEISSIIMSIDQIRITLKFYDVDSASSLFVYAFNSDHPSSIGFLSFFITTIFVFLYSCRFSCTLRFALITFSRCRLQTSKSTFSCPLIYSISRLLVITLSVSSPTSLFIVLTLASSSFLFSAVYFSFLSLSRSILNFLCFSAYSVSIRPFSIFFA